MGRSNGAPWSLFYQDANPSPPSHLPEAPPPDTNTLEVRFQCMDLEGTQTLSRVMVTCSDQSHGGDAWKPGLQGTGGGLEGVGAHAPQKWTTCQDHCGRVSLGDLWAQPSPAVSVAVAIRPVCAGSSCPRHPHFSAPELPLKGKGAHSGCQQGRGEFNVPGAALHPGAQG